MEYVRPAMGRNGARFEYELLFDGELARSAPQMIGLIDVEMLHAAHPQSAATVATLQGQAAHLAPRLQAARTVLAPTLQGTDIATNAGIAATSSVLIDTEPEKALLPPAGINGRSRTASRAVRAGASSLNSSLLAAEA
jgi:hypothetical protein